MWQMKNYHGLFNEEVAKLRPWLATVHVLAVQAGFVLGSSLCLRSALKCFFRRWLGSEALRLMIAGTAPKYVYHSR
jgi:hypothetical protein